MNKIIFFDVDSTIYSHKTQSIPSSTIYAINKAKENGYTIVVATGRNKLLISQLGILDVINFDYFITINGTLILDNKNNIIYKALIDKSDIKKIMDITDKLDYNFAFITENDYFLYHKEDTRSHLGYDPLHIPVPKNAPYIMQDIYQINLFCKRDEVDEYIINTQDNLTYTALNNYGFDVYLKGNTKATGINYLLKYLKMDQSDTICIGDGINDLDMIKFCKISIAMGNSLQLIKDNASFITTDVDSDGIYNALKYFNII